MRGIYFLQLLRTLENKRDQEEFGSGLNSGELNSSWESLSDESGSGLAN
jgi:hypothetical protein